MKTSSQSPKIFSLILFSLLCLFLNSFSYGKDIDFNISTSNIYYPGDKIDLNINSYSYFDEKNSDKKATFKISILRIKDINTFYSKQVSRYGIEVLSKDSLNLLYLTEEVDTFEKTITSKKEYSYRSLNESIPLNVSSKGAYLIKVTSGNKVAYCGFIISNLGIISKAGNNSMLAFVVERQSGAPVSNADLSFYLGANQIGQGRTADGLFFQTVSDEVKNAKDEDLIPMIIGKYNDDIVVSDSYLFFGYSGNKFYTYMFTEQPVYRTNSEVNFKGTIRKNISNKLEPLVNKELTVIIKDSKGAEVYKEVLRTNEMGSFDGKYKIEEEGALGDYIIYANIDENNSYSASFTVEQYKKPEYKVTVTTDQSQYFGKDKLQADVEAKYFFGSPVTDAEVEYNIYKVRYYKPWWMFSEYAWWYADYYENQDDNQKFSGAEMVYSGTGKLDKEGKMVIDYQLNEEFKNDQGDDYYGWYRRYYQTDYRYIVQANVVDKSRREISGTATAFVTRGGFSLSANTDKYLYKPDETVNIEVYASDFSDKPVQTPFEAIIYKSVWQRDHNKSDRDYIKTIMGSTKADGKGIVSFDIGTGDVEGSYNVEIKAKDQRSNEITTSAYFYVSDGKNMWWYYNEAGGIQIITDKDNYKQGEICKALILVTNPDVNALVSTNTDDVIYYSVEKFTGTSKMVEIPITEKYTSGFEINVNYVYQGTFYNSSKNILVIPEEKFLTVQIDPSKLIYKPKETGELKVRVLDYNGNPVRNAEVSLGVVDESIYSIKEDKTKDIRKFFYGQRFANVSTTFNNSYTSNGSSRLITIYERFNIKSTSESELATVKGKVYGKGDEPISNVTIVVNDDYKATETDEEGNFEFKLPAGSYDIKIYYRGADAEESINIKLEKGTTRNVNIYFDKNTNELLKAVENGRDGEHKEFATKKDSDAPRGGIVTDEIEIRGAKNKISPDQSGRIVGTEMVEPDVRTDFRDAIFWSPYSMTDAEGYAVVFVKYPDNLTAWRITSRVITEDTKVGQMTSTVITRKDLLIRMETPRFLQENDEVTISTIIHNYLEKEKEVRVKFRGENVIMPDGSDERTIDLPPNTDMRLDWKIKVMQPVGEAKLYAEALTNEESDAMEVKIPLQPKGLKIIENTIADFSDEIKTETRTVTIPSGTDLRSAGLNLTVDPSLAATILSALDELVGYPYGCVEQTMSRFLPTVVVANAFLKLDAPVSEATKKDLPSMVNKGLQRLYGFQHSDGGWGWWENDGSNPFMTAYVVYGLSLAKQANYEIKDGVLKKGISAIKQQLDNSGLDATTRAYMLYALAVAEEKNEDFFKKEIDKIISSDMNDYARSLIAMTWKLIGNENKAKDALSQLEKNVKTTGEGAAYWEGKQFHYRWQEDKVQTTAMALKAIVSINDNSDLKDKVVRWLIMQRQGTAWRNTQETAMIIYAMVDYLKSSNELVPSYNVKVFVNGQNVFEKQMNRDDVFKKSENVKINSSILRNGDNEIKIEKSGTGKVYFSSNTIYYNTSNNISANEEGFRVEKEFFKLEKYDSYTEDKITYRKKYMSEDVKSGDEILVKIRVYSKSEEYQYFMLEDPLPSGVEVIKDDWAYTIEEEKNYTGYDYYFWRWWYADKEVRDNRVTFFVTYLGKGEYEFSYIMRAQIPGDYVVNPAKGMLMYYPEVNGNSPNLKLKITD